jgi:hypothetical protein
MVAVVAAAERVGSMELEHTPPVDREEEEEQEREPGGTWVHRHTELHVVLLVLLHSYSGVRTGAMKTKA